MEDEYNMKKTCAHVSNATLFLGECSQPSCYEQRRRLVECVFPRSFVNRHGQNNQWLDMFRNKRVLIAGDSMARQSFTTLVALMRGMTDVVDMTTHLDIHWRRSEFGSTSIDKVYWSPSCFERNCFTESKFSHSIDFMFIPCYNDRFPGRFVNLLATYDFVYLYLPTYWHVSGMCKTSHVDVLRFVKTVSRNSNASKLVLINAPTETIRDGKRIMVERMNQKSKVASRQTGIRYIDWDRVTREHSFVHVNDNWHYVCFLLEKDAFYSRNVLSKKKMRVITRQNGDCFETANTYFWTQYSHFKMDHFSTSKLENLRYKPSTIVASRAIKH
jgi:hypothetical protein